MNTIQILKDLSRICYPKNNFAVIPADYLPEKIPIRPFYLVVNTANSTDIGEHWISIYVPCKYTQKIEYMDSFGLPPNNHHFLKFIRNNCKQYVFNPVQIQSDNSSVCGEYSTCFLYQRKMEKKKLKQFINQFSASKLEKNDVKIVKMYNKIQKMHKRNRVTRVKTTQLGRGHSSINNSVCNQSCLSRIQLKKKTKNT